MMSRIFVAFDDMGKTGIKANLGVIEELASANENVTIDMSRVIKLDGSGIGAVAYVKRRLNAKGHDIAVVNASEPASAMLKDLGLEQLIRGN
jgi:anti-anti-sigma regulatory factor